MIVLDTCSAVNCYTISTIWLANLKKCCADKKIIWTATTNRELIGLSKSKKSLEALITKLENADNVEHFDTNDLEEKDLILYMDYLLDVSNNDSDLFFDEFPKGKFSLGDLQSNGKNRLSEEDRELIALSRLLNSTLATDDKRILKILDTFYKTQSYICSPKIIEKIKNIATLRELKEICHKKEVWVYSNYNRNTTVVC